MIEADVLLGTLDSGDGRILPIMAHPPHTTSDLSLETFLRSILAHNKANPDNAKGVKLDFKSIESFDGSVNLLETIWPLVIYLFFLLKFAIETHLPKNRLFTDDISSLDKCGYSSGPAE